MEHDIIVIIGNGFDLNLGLKTGYRDFIASDIFNSLVLSGNHLCDYLKSRLELQHWIDIENELKIYSYDVCKSDDRKPFKKEYQELCKSLCDYLKSLDLSQIDKTSKAYKFIRFLSNRSDVLILNFNYTDSADYILDDGDKKFTVLNIHGKAKENQIVFGVEDDARINDKDIFLKKSTCTWNEIVDIDNYLTNASQIVFWGYSLGETDHHYFEEFFRSVRNKHSAKGAKHIFIYHYGEEGHDDILRQIDELTIHGIHALRSNNDFNMADLAKP